MKRLLRDKRGDTLVEIVVSFALLILFISALAGAIGYANKMEAQAKAVRDATYQASLAMTEGVEPGDGHPEEYTFKSGRLDEKKRDKYPFSIKVNCTTVTFEGEDENGKKTPYIFFTFKPVETTGGS